MMQQDGMFSLQGSRHYYHRSRVSRTILGGAVLQSSDSTLEVHAFYSKEELIWNQHGCLWTFPQILARITTK